MKLPHGNSRRALTITALFFLLVSGLSCRKPDGAAGTGADSDPFAAAVSEVEDKAEIPYIEASRPILGAMASQDYNRLFELMSSHALKRVQPDQFAPMLDSNGNQIASSPISDMTKEQFLESMGRMESELGTPFKVINLYVQTIDPNELAGKDDAFSTMMNIGAMSPEIPFEIRKASIRAQMGVRIPEKYVTEWAEEMGCSEDDVRSGKAFVGREADFDSGGGPYMNVKLVLIDDAGQLKVGYFEFMPPSMMD